ncbi:NAD(P)/FAD-dependent oxidoreductase [Paracoccus denitrificans]|jgi:NADPH-dependent 2,4-dienoyl-CoA reductase/sulfur reductase-like enzyme|uniref:Cytochrome-dependent sulfide dehydrogenase (Flavoprotein) n=1 Tax=Paracoccus denitrificans (strain Pd 1222) TaxID=318586 RepID=A1B9M8_PARDP|nr:NAD(P)/FAD-dependent oxidoreductase [Paracoccus denitrificans]ABL72222.1 cytochrome-dependent sulfide dehydrogenase (flavoprotein) [Paracoccus denitrificans PD1222]MBB4625859.1 NADPH-dependent 2,4-dienoyl-CoA reductase/sulfur reductase-like enzyme [Paracoccus denitrificans]MCU7426977.1 NAD(P)/FAD-dependent oxidoreductase [Paracoccus denitrificans]QAR28795.1 NAD(P)/FAD-dependent oxidoreductase [Paracoccus denitrificans]UPV96942.1 NAD(P)/FAD-dependent oxidoreductase [Paracoccus denitrificans]
MILTRRELIAGSAAATGLLYAPAVLGQGKPKVVVIGGGAGGGTAARYLAKDSQGALDVTLVEADPVYTTCFFSNLHIGGLRDFDSLRHGYDKMAAGGVTVVNDRATAVDREARTVTLAGGQVLAYDRLVLSPGIDFVEDSVPGWSLDAAEIMPHAYKAGPQTELLKRMIQAMPQGGTFAMVAPPNPYRCPPGPYERASMVAHLLKQTNPTAKIIILDAKEKFSKQALFEEGWGKYYDGMIEWINPEFGGADVAVRPDSMEVVVEGVAQKVDCCNVIPAQTAGRIAAIAGLTDESGWAPVHPDSMKSRIDGNAWVLGDSSAQGDMPKSAFSANSQAKVAAMAIRAELTGSRLFPAKYSNTCWSLLAPEDGVKLGASYEPNDDRIASVESFISDTGEDAALRRRTYEESLGWYAGITADIFG